MFDTKCVHSFRSFVSEIFSSSSSSTNPIDSIENSSTLSYSTHVETIYFFFFNVKVERHLSLVTLICVTIYIQFTSTFQYFSIKR